MKCIGKACDYNKCNSGEFCNLSNGLSVQKGDKCIIGDVLEGMNKDKQEIEDEITRLYKVRCIIRMKQNQIEK